MSAKCANCHKCGERHWNHMHTLELGRCMADKKKRMVVLQDPMVVRLSPCREYDPIDANWIPPKKVPRKSPAMIQAEREENTAKKHKKVKK